MSIIFIHSVFILVCVPFDKIYTRTSESRGSFVWLRIGFRAIVLAATVSASGLNLFYTKAQCATLVVNIVLSHRPAPNMVAVASSLFFKLIFYTKLVKQHNVSILTLVVNIILSHRPSSGCSSSVISFLSRYFSHPSYILLWHAAFFYCIVSIILSYVRWC